MAKGRKSRQRPPGRSPGVNTSERKRSRDSRATMLWALGVALSAVLVYANAFGNEFVLDDIGIIRDNVRIRSLAGLPHLFASSYWGQGGAQALYRPLVLVTYALNYAAHGLSTGGYIAVNISLHAAVSLLVFELVRRIGGSLFVAGVSGVAFAILPVHTEAVTGMSGRPELLAAFFFLLAMLLHRFAAGASKSRAAACRIGMLACFACALLSKESAMTLILVLPLMDALVPSIGSDGHPLSPRSRIIPEYVPVAAVAIAYLVVRHAVLGGVVIAGSAIAPLDNPLVPISTMPLGESLGATTGQALMTAFAIIADYVRLLAWPARLSPDYSYNQIPLVTSVLDLRFLSGVAFVVVSACSIVLLWRRRPVAAFGLAFAAATFSIVSNLAITIGTICAERLIYLPSAGILIAASVGVEQLIGSRQSRRRMAYCALGVALVIGAVRTTRRNRDWQTESTLWSSAILAAPGSARVQSEYGRLIMGRAEEAARAGRTDDSEKLYREARAHLETAVRIYPSYSLPIDSLAMIDSLHGRFDDAMGEYERALKAWPGNYASLTNWGAALRERATQKKQRASALRAEGRNADADETDREADADIRQATQKIDRAIAMMPSYPHAHLVRALLCDGDLDNPTCAVEEFEQVLRLVPDHPQRPLIESELGRLKSQLAAGAPAR
jgi:tetratricopeptide (TPR) repeat protein